MAHILAESYAGRHGHVAVAIASVVLALLLAAVVDRVLRRAQGARAVSQLLDAGADTRLRFLRRVIEAAIVVLGIAVALSQFTALDRLAASVLASGAIAAAIVGFAARQTLANAVAGILLAVSQPLRLGDLVTFEGETGTVEDVRLTYTFLRTAAGVRIVIPNERLAAGVLRNQTVLGPAAAEASAWLPHGVDVDAVIAAIERDEPEVTVSIAESSAEGTRLSMVGPVLDVARRAEREARLRRAATRAARGAQGP
jgi:small-conductance mechanosensitive channel